MPSYHFVFLLLCLPVQFLLQNVFCKLINIFVFFVFILVDAFGFPVFWFQKDREITKNHFTLAENNFGERKLSCTPLTFDEILFAGTERAVLGGLYHSSLPARPGSQSEHRIRRTLSNLVPRVLSSTIFKMAARRAAILKIVEDKALGTRLHSVRSRSLPYNKCAYGSSL